MEAPTSPAMPCKMDLDKVMVSNRPAEVLRGAAGAEHGAHGAQGALSSWCHTRNLSHPCSSSLGLMGFPTAPLAPGDIPALCRRDKALIVAVAGGC